MAVETRTERVTVARLRGRRYDVELRYEGWVQMQSRRVRPRRDLAPRAARLQDEETGDAVWSATRVSAILPRLRLGDGQGARSPPTASSSCSPMTSPQRPRPGIPSPQRPDGGVIDGRHHPLYEQFPPPDGKTRGVGEAEIA
jgi:hypothetical protein